MREFVLNHASLSAPDGADLTSWLVDIASGMATLIDHRVAQRVLRMHRPVQEIRCRPGHSLYEAFAALRPDNRDAYVFLMRLAQKVPVSEGLGHDTKDRLDACESLRPSGTDGEPLLVCAFNDGVAVGFPSLPDWDRSQLRITFEELLSDGELGRAEEVVDNLTRAVHAEEILRRHRDRQSAGATAKDFWARRQDSFPNLLFGPEVEDHLREHERLLPQIKAKLTALDDSVRSWAEGPVPAWKSHVTSESSNVRNTPKLRDARRFGSERGGRKLFFWHARVGRGYRIHFRFDASDRSLEIGYIGPHLPVN